MFKRIMAIIILSSLLSATAHAAWFLNTWVKSGGGTIVVRGGTPQTSANGSVYKSYTTSKPFTVAVNPNVGYSISQVNYNNVNLAAPFPTSYTVQGPGSQNVFAWFAAQQLTVTASTGAGGSVTPTSLSGIYYGTKLTSARNFTFTPSPATSGVSSITGVPTGATVSLALPATAGMPVTVTLPVGFTFTSDIALVGSFYGPPVAKTGPPQVVLAGTLVTLDGSSSTGIIDSYSWTQTAGPGFPDSKVIADITSGAMETFTPSVLGNYTFILTVTGGSTASTTVTVTDDIAAAMRTQCYNCHVQNNVGVASNTFGNWSSSGHKSKALICSQCHVGANTGGHPGPLRSGSVNETTFTYNAPYGSGNFCITCHNPSILTDFAASKHSVAAGSASCGYCHKPGVHNPKALCNDCHYSGNPYGLPWPPAGFDFHSAFDSLPNVCIQCHKTHNPKILSIEGCK